MRKKGNYLSLDQHRIATRDKVVRNQDLKISGKIIYKVIQYWFLLSKGATLKEIYPRISGKL